MASTVCLLLLGGCGLVSGWLTPTPAPVAPVVAPAPRVAATEPPVAPPEPVLSPHAKRLITARADLKTVLTSLELRAVSVCDKGRLTGEGCVAIQKTIDQARTLDERLVKALLDPKIEIDWPAVTALLRMLVEQAKEAKP